MATAITPEYLARSGTEHGEQMAVFCWAAGARAQVPDLRWMYAIPNGGGRSMSQGSALKAEGVKKGVADICWPVPRGEFAGLYIEMKKLNGVPSDVSDEQADFGAFVILKGYQWRVCFGWLQATALLYAYYEGAEYVMSPHQNTVHDRVMELVNAPN